MTMREQTLTQLKTGDIIEWRDGKFGVNRRWRIHSIHIGAVDQESVICIEAVDRTPAWDEIHIPLMWVPEVLTRQCRIAGTAACTCSFKTDDMGTPRISICKSCEARSESK